MMNKRLKNLIFPILLILLPTAGLANDGHFYFGVGLGNSQFQLNEPNLVADYSSLGDSSGFDDNSTSLNLYGGITLDEHLAIETDFIVAGDISAMDAGRKQKLFDVSTVAISAVLSTQISDRTRLFGKIGVHAWDISESSGELETINNAVDLTYGLGADINIYDSDARQLRIQWNHFDYDGVFIESNDIVSISLRIQTNSF